MDKIMHKLLMTDLIVLEKINDKKRQTPIEIVYVTKLPKTTVYRSLEKLIGLKLITKEKGREGCLIPHKRIKMKLLKVLN